MQKALIITTELGNRELNEFLRDGWKVTHTCQMPSSVAIGDDSMGSRFVNLPTCLVVIESPRI